MPTENIATLDPSRQLKPIVYRKPGEESKGGEYHGGPRRWTGRGPPPARHIPWPEIFKHHISVIEGHKKMIDMVRKHTVSGTGNWRTINDMFNRTDEMLRMSRQISYTFTPPPGQRERVPLGVSSDSMYPGYSPADHEYGKAAEEYGKAVAEAKKRGVEIPKHPDIDYKIGQGKGIKRKNLAQMREMKQGSSGSEGEGPAKKGSSGSEGESPAKKGGSGSEGEDPAKKSGSGSEGESPAKKGWSTEGLGPSQKFMAPGNVALSQMNRKENDPEIVGVQMVRGNPVFVVDTNPTPVNIPHHLSSPSKRDAEDEGARDKKTKKSKTKHSGDLPAADKKADDTEDISAEVEARMKAKEERRKQKEEKKRKRESRESEKSDVATTEPANAAATEGGEKPKKKKNKVKHTEEGNEQSNQKPEKKRSGEDDGEEGEKKKNKKRRKD